MPVSNQDSLSKPHKIHRYKRIEYPKSGRVAYRCVLPGCSHFKWEEFMMNAVCMCKCGKEFIFTKAHVYPRKKVNPHCPDCNRPTYNRKLGKVHDHRKPTEGPSQEEILKELEDLLS